MNVAMNHRSTYIRFTAAAILAFAAVTLLPAQTTSAPAQTQLPAPAQQQGNAPQTTPPAAGTPAAAPDASAAQQSETTPGAPTITVYSREVNQVFTVTDRHGRFVTGLQQQNFGLLDDGRPPLRVVRFTQQTNLPLRVGLMIDTSSSIRQRFQFEQQAATDFLLQVLHQDDRAFVEGFDVSTDISQDYTNRIDLLDTGIRKLRPGGGTSLFDAMYKTCRDQMLTLRQTVPVRRAIVLVSDGDDDYSRVLETEAIKECQRAETIIYAISTNVGPSKDKGDDVLKQIAEATGGQAFFPDKIEDVSIGFKSIEEELRSQYLLVYVPSNFRQDGSFRTVYLQSLDQRYSVRTRKGYFAPKAE